MMIMMLLIVTIVMSVITLVESYNNKVLKRF